MQSISAVRRPFEHDSECALSKLVALLPNSMNIFHNWLSIKDVQTEISGRYYDTGTVHGDRAASDDVPRGGIRNRQHVTRKDVRDGESTKELLA